MIIIEKEYSTRQTSCRTWLHVQHVFFHPSILVNEDYLTNLEILWTPLGNISQCKVRFSRSWIFCPLDIAAPPTFPPSCENFGTSDMKVPYFLPPMDKRLQGNNGGASESQCLGGENPDGRKTKTCLGRIHPFFGVRANKMPIRSPECFLIWVWKIVDPNVQQGFMTTDPFQVYPIGYVSNFGSSGSSSWRLFQCHASQPRLRTMSFCVKVPTVNRMPPGFSLATPNHHPSFYSRFFNRIIECR